jgi:sodium/proline symporter
MNVVLAIVILYFAVMFAIGYWANTKMASSKEFLVAGQTLGFFVMAIATFSSIQSGFGMIGHTANTYAWGLQAIIAAALLVPLSFALSWFLLGARLYRLARTHEVYSVPDVVKVRYPHRSAHFSMSVAMFVGSVAYMTAQITAMGVIVGIIFDTSVTMGAIIGSVVVAAYTIAGGMLAAVWTDQIQGLLMIVMAVAAFFVATRSAGGWSEMIATVASAIPVTINGLGIREGIWVWSLGLYGVGNGEALAYALVVLGVALGTSALGGVVYAVGRGELTPRLTRRGGELCPAAPQADTERGEQDR